MHVTGHQHAGMDGATKLGGEFLKRMQVELVILLGIETDRAMVAALDDVPRYTRNGEAWATRHEEFSVMDRLRISRKTWFDLI